jgi:hypothetical protein
VIARTRRRNRGRGSHSAFAGRAARGMNDVIPLGGGTIIVVAPRWDPRSERIIPDMRFKIPNGEMGNIVRRFVSRVRKARTQPTRELRRGKLLLVSSFERH